MQCLLPIFRIYLTLEFQYIRQIALFVWHKIKLNIKNQWKREDSAMKKCKAHSIFCYFSRKLLYSWEYDHSIGQSWWNAETSKSSQFVALQKISHANNYQLKM